MTKEEKREIITSVSSIKVKPILREAGIDPSNLYAGRPVKEEKISKAYDLLMEEFEKRNLIVKKRECD